MARILVHLPQSPWSEKARWALDHHGVGYRAVEHVPMVFEPALRVLGGSLTRPGTVPMLIDGGTVVRDSLAIAQHAERIGRGSPLFPERELASVLAWNERAERFMRAARTRLMARLAASDEALVESVPTWMRPAGRATLPIARLGAAFIASKHDRDAPPPAENEATMSSVLELADRTLAGREHLVGDTFTFADVALACALGFVSPHARIPLGPASRRVFRETAFEDAFPSLLVWRDQLVERHR